MTPPKAAKGWAIFDPYGDPVFVSFLCTPQDAAEQWAGKVGGNWPMHERNGYRCLPCTITVSEDER